MCLEHQNWVRTSFVEHFGQSEGGAECATRISPAERPRCLGRGVLYARTDGGDSAAPLTGRHECAIVWMHDGTVRVCVRVYRSVEHLARIGVLLVLLQIA